MIIIGFVGPCVLCGHFDLSILVDEDVEGSDVSNFGPFGMEFETDSGHGVEEIPELILFKLTGLCLKTIFNRLF